MRRRASKGRKESGYALLFVLAMASIVAIMLYMQLPRVAFEAQRDREQLLIDRGEQYSRAIKLYVRKFNRFPADMDALDSTQNIRFLRRHYIDPMTGKSEWRLIHVGPGGVFTDSLLHKKPAADQFAAQNFITEMQQVGGNQNGNGEGVNLANRRRASDQPGAPGDANSINNSSGQPNGSNTDPNAPPGSAPIQGPVMVLPNGQIVPASTSGYPSANPTPGQAGTQQPGQPSLPGQPGQPTQPGLPNGFQTQPNQPGAPPTAASSLINQLLTTPRPGGLNGIPGVGGQPSGVDQFGNPLQAPAGAGTGTSTATLGTPAGQGMGGAAIGGGLAGVASKLEQDGIKSYNDHTAYNEWEFVYDMTKDPARGAGAVPPAQAPPGTPLSGPNSAGPNATPFATPTSNPIVNPTSAQPGAPGGFTSP